MAVSTTSSVVVYTGNGVTKAFPVPFPYDVLNDIKVYLNNTLLSRGTHYDLAGSTVTMVTAPASGASLRIQRILPLTQVVTFQVQGPLDPTAIERAVDRLVMMFQQLNDGLAVNTQHGDQPGGSLHETATRTKAGFASAGLVATVEDHVLVLGNPHGTSASDVGAAPVGHNHDDKYPPIGHNHDSVYAKTSHNHDSSYATRTEINVVGGRLDTVEAALPNKADASALAGKADKATTLAGYGIVDAATAGMVANKADKATTLAGYGITDALQVGTTVPQALTTSGGVAGTATEAARADHRHAVSAAVTPVTIGTANALGSSTSLARADHVHHHGNQTDPNLHGTATGSTHGFMASGDKTKLDALPDNAALTALLNGKVGTSDSRLTDARVPLAHVHAEFPICEGRWRWDGSTYNRLAGDAGSVVGSVTSGGSGVVDVTFALPLQTGYRIIATPGVDASTNKPIIASPTNVVDGGFRLTCNQPAGSDGRPIELHLVLFGVLK